MKTKSFFIICVALIAINLAGAFTASSASYNLELGNLNYGARDGSSTNYNASLSLIDQPILKGSNNNYNIELGFFNGDFIYTPPESNPPITGGGKGTPGGGTSRLLKDYTFMLMQDTIKVTMKQGGYERKILQIKNKGDAYQEMKVFQEGLKENLIIPEKQFLLGLEGDLKIPLQFYAGERIEPGIYTGKLKIVGERETKMVILIVEVLSKEALFDIKVNVKENSKEINPGEEVEASIDLFNLGDLKPVDIELNYSILDSEGRVIDFEHETLAVNEEVSLMRSLDTRISNKPGVYSFSGILKYANITVTSSDQFVILEKTKYLISSRLFLLITGMIVLLFILLLFTRKSGDKRDKFQRRLDDYIERRQHYRKDEDYEKYIEKKQEIKKLEEYKPGTSEDQLEEGEEIIGKKDYVVREYEIKGRDNIVKQYIVKTPIKEAVNYKAIGRPTNIVEAFRKKGLSVYGAPRKREEKQKEVRMIPAKREYSVLLNMIQYYRDHGYDKESIKEILMQKRWPEKLVDDYLRMVK